MQPRVVVLRLVVPLAAAVAVAMPALRARGQAPPASASRPNIVFVLTDDQDASIEHMRRLRSWVADAGVFFENSFVSVPMCCPSRATLLTGLYAHSHGVLGNKLPLGGFEKFRSLGLESSTLGTWLQAAGYRTALIGKYLNRYPGDGPGADPAYVPPGWDDWAAFFMPDHTLPFHDYVVNANGRPELYARSDVNYSTDDMARRALAFLDAAEKRDDAQPFFLFVAPSAPHVPAEPAARHKGSFSGYPAPHVGAFNEEDMSDKPRYYQALAPLSEADIRKLDKLYQARWESLMAVDELIDALFERLSEYRELEHTWFFFSSDNGFLLGQHRFRQGKDVPYEESIRVPLVVRGPGTPAGARRPHLVVNVDLPATFVELGGARPDRVLEGRSLVALLGAAPPAESAWRRDFLIEHWRDPDDADAVPEFAGLRSATFKYIEYETGERELYSMETDAEESHNLVGRADQAAVLQQLAARLAQLKTCRGEACR